VTSTMCVRPRPGAPATVVFLALFAAVVQRQAVDQLAQERLAARRLRRQQRRAA